jgi:hypothetical protein
MSRTGGGNVPWITSSIHPMKIIIVLIAKMIVGAALPMAVSIADTGQGGGDVPNLVRLFP